MLTLLVLQLLLAAAMAGLIWCIQLVHYPMFAHLDPRIASRAIEEHGRGITFVVAPLMLGELLCALALWRMTGHLCSVLGLILVVALWLSTALLQMPCHHQLTRQFSTLWVRRLVLSNWLRTALWTARAALSAVWLLQACCEI